MEAPFHCSVFLTRDELFLGGLGFFFALLTLS